MTEEKKKIVDLMLKNFKHDRTFENEHFFYWIKESFGISCGPHHAEKEISGEEFDKIREYVIDNGCYPDYEIIDSNRFPFRRKTVIRYSKTYDNLEFYRYDTDIRPSYKNKSNRVLALSKREKVFSVNHKNYVLIGGKRWLSLKNWKTFYNNNYSNERCVRYLMSLMIGKKDWIMDVEFENSLIQNKFARISDSLEDAIENECGDRPSKALVKVFNGNINEIVSFYKIIDSNKIHLITNFLKRNRNSLKKLFSMNNYATSDMLMYYYFLSRDNRCDRNVLTDYFRMLREDGKTVNLSIKSYSKLKLNHDNISRRILQRKSKSEGKIKVKKEYPRIKSVPGIEVELIKTAYRLNMESHVLHHCVHGYKDRINRGECAIYSLTHEGETYTLEIEGKKIDDKSDNQIYDFKMVQLRGKYNCNPPVSIKKGLEVICKENNLLPLSDKLIKFNEIKKEKEKEKEKIKIEQIGEEILDRLVFKGHTAHYQAMEEDLPF